jgi:CRISPR-associated endonuclease Cas2
MKQRTGAKKGEVAYAILRTIGIAGLVYISLSSPRAVRALYKHMWRKISKKGFKSKAVDRSFENLRRRGLVTFVSTANGARVVLTEKGRVELLAYELHEKMLEKPKRWDQKWRLLIFDIEEKKRKRRDDIRRTLIGLGFYRLQDSVWVYPYDCEEVLELIRTKYHVRHDALFIRADRVTNDRWLRQHFQLA